MRLGAFELFHVRDYRRLWAAGALIGMARWLEFIALGIYAYQITKSPPLVAFLAVLRMMPYVALGFFVGALADRVDRRYLLIACTFVMLVTATTMAILTATGNGSYTAVALATMVSGAYWTVDMPVRRRLLVDVAGAHRVAQALGFDNATNYLTRALGPLTGGITYQLLGIQGIYALIAAAYGICTLLAWRIDVTELAAHARQTRGRVLDALKLPLGLILNRRFGVIMGVTLVYNLCCFPFTTMVPVIAQKDFMLVPILVGVLSACEGIGGTLGAIVAGMFGSERTLFRTYYVGTITMLFLMLGLSFRLEFAFAVGTLLLIGGAAACFSATQYALVHILSPPDVRGRATGVLSLFIGSSMFGHYIAGQLFGAYSSPIAMRVMALSGIAAMGVLGLAWASAREPRANTA